MSRFRRRPSPAFVVAILALAVALGGTSFAANPIASISALINGKKIKKNSIPGNRLKKNTVTGKQIKESKLARVPKAKVAGAAGNAAKLGGKPAAGFETFAQQSIPAGTTVTGAFGFQHFVGGGPANDHMRQAVSLPGTASANLITANVNFGAAAGAVDADPTCNGTPAAPTAPAGKVCLYLTSSAGPGTTFQGEGLPPAGNKFGFVVRADNAANPNTGVYGIWAYTQP